MNKKIIIGIVIVLLWLLFQIDTSSSTQTENNSSYVSIPTPKPINFQYSSPTGSGSLYFNGYPCTQDCSGHEAGYEWAEEKGIDDIDDCGGNSNSFIEGCESYVEENYPDWVYDY